MIISRQLSPETITRMVGVFTILRIFGIFPYRIIKNSVFCSKWRYYSYLFALLASLITFNRGLMYIRNTEVVELKDSSFVYQFILKFEPMFYFVHMSVVFYNALETKRMRQALKLLDTFLKLQPRKHHYGLRNGIVTYIFGTLLFQLLLVFKLHHLNLHLYPNVTWVNLVDFLVAYLCTVIIAMQLLLFCVVLNAIRGVYGRLERSMQDLDEQNREASIGILDTIQKLGYFTNKFDRIYYPSIILHQFNCFLYILLGSRSFYDLLSGQYLSIIHSLILNMWIIYHVPIQFYLMHLSEVIQNKVSFVPT